MIRFVSSSRTEDLLATLVTDLRPGRRKTNPFVPTRIVVPNRSLERYVRFGIAKATGFAGNLETGDLRTLLADLVEPGHRPLDRDAVLGLLLSIMLDENELGAAELAPVRDYLFAAGTDERAVGLRRYQLATQLARYFEEYAYSRPELLGEARRGGSDVEQWQHTLWQRILARADERRSATGIRWHPLSDVLSRIARGRIELRSPLHLFGLSTVAPFFLQLFKVLAPRIDLYVYALSPCVEDDLTAPDDASPDDPFGLLQTDTPALRLCGRPPRETLRLLKRVAGDLVTTTFEAPTEAPRTLLQRFQRDTVLRAPERSGMSAEPDGSIHLIACPSIRREAETIADEIWSLVRSDPSLHFNDIAVIVNARESEAYFTHLSAAFDEAHSLPHNIIGLPFRATSRIAEAITLLLALPLSRFTRADLLRVITHPVVLAQLPETSAQDCVDWCDRAGILHGADRADHAGTYIEEDILSWDQGLRRLALGTFLPGPRSGFEQPLQLATGSYLPEELGPSDATNAARFGLLVRSLIGDAKFASSASLTLREWGAFLQALLETYLHTPTPSDEGDRARCISAIQSAFQLDIDGKQIGYTTAQSMALAALEGLSGSRGQHLVDGVVIATTQPLRVPFRVVMLAGMGEGKFPSTERPSHLDLRRLDRQAGDVSPREQDASLFLESILCTRDHLRVSYVARDSLTGEALQPSSVVVELLGILERGYIGATGIERLTRRVPLRRHRAPGALPAAHREAQAFALREDWQARFHLAPPRKDLQRHVTATRWPLLANALGISSIPTAIDESDGPLRLSFAALRRFLECPLQGHARAVLGLGDEEPDDQVEREGEPFETPRLLSAPLLAEVCLDAVSRGADLGATLDARVHLEVLAGRMPSGVFREVERGEHLGVLENWAALLGEHAAKAGALRIHTARFGRAEENARVEDLHPPIRLDVEYRTPSGTRRRVVELFGKTEPLLGSGGSILLAWRKLNKAHDKAPEYIARGKRYLRAFFDNLALAAADLRPARPYSALMEITDGVDGLAAAAEFRPLPPERARSYLAMLAGELLSGPHSYLLPCDAVFEAHLHQTDDYASIVTRLFAPESRERPSSLYGPVTHLERFTHPPEADAVAMVQRRFGLFFERFREVL